MKTSASPKVYQIKMTLNNIRPPIWRRVLVSDNITLFDLHKIIQRAFGWYNCHLHEFTIHAVPYGDPASDEFDEFGLKDEIKFTLRKLKLSEGSRFTYEYDFGDSWEHTLILEKILPFAEGTDLPQCIKGKRACPPEDVGGPWGYQGFLEAINDPQNKEHDSYREWIGEFDPEAFDLEDINKRLHQPKDLDLDGLESILSLGEDE